MNRAILILATCLLISSCATGPSTADPNGRTLIESDPPGAKIEIDSQYVGITPLRVNISADKNIYGNLLQQVSVVAYPTSSGQQTQKKILFSGDFIPTHMFFDMNLVAVPNSSNLNLTLDSPQNANRAPTPEEVRVALAKARSDGDKKFEGEILQYAKEHGINVE